MTSYIITEKSLKKNGKRLMKDFYEIIHDEYLLKTHNVFKLQRKFFDENIMKIFLNFYKKEEEDYHKIYFGDKKYEDLPEMTNEDFLVEIEKIIMDKTIDHKLVYDFLERMDRKLKIDTGHEFESEEDLFCLKKTFIKAYELFYYDNYNLKD